MKRFAMTVTSKGQVTLPAEYRRLVGVDAGGQLELVMADDGQVTLTKRHPDLRALKDKARQAKASGATDESWADEPVGMDIAAADDRTRRARR